MAAPPVGMRRLWVFAAALAMAGCMGNGGAESIAGPSGGVTDEARFSDSTGAIDGTILSDELMPVANATAGVVETGARTTADAVGHFAFSNLEPGTYRVQAAAHGYQSQIQTVKVEPGAAVAMKFGLTAVPSDGPFHHTYPAKGLVRSVVWRVGSKCDTVVQPPLGTCLGIQFTDVTKYVDTDPDWATIIDEAQWVPNSAVFHQRAYIFATFPNVTDFSGVPDFKSPGHFEAGGKSPVVMKIPRETIRARGFPEQSQYGHTRFRAVNNFDDVNATGLFGVSVMIDQPMNVYITVFYKEAAPLDFTALPDK